MRKSSSPASHVSFCTVMSRPYTRIARSSPNGAPPATLSAAYSWKSWPQRTMIDSAESVHDIASPNVRW